MIGLDSAHDTGVVEQWRNRDWVRVATGVLLVQLELNGIADNLIYLAEVMVGPVHVTEGIKVFKVRGCGGEPHTVYHQVVVVANAHSFSSQGHHALDVKGVLGKVVDSLGFEYDDFAALGMAEIISDAVDEQVVSGRDLHLEYVFAFPKLLTIKQV